MNYEAGKYRKSRQRDRILEILQNTKSHPTADTIYLMLKEEFPDLSLGNVYRNLNILVETGMIQRLILAAPLTDLMVIVLPIPILYVKSAIASWISK
jgi:Fe2+ or Zn2+ uptake regulation protein